MLPESTGLRLLTFLLVWLVVCVGAETEKDFDSGCIPLTNSKHENLFVKLMLVCLRAAELLNIQRKCVSRTKRIKIEKWEVKK